MAISASDVKALRDKTGAGMMDCKKALTDANGDFAQAERILKELGLAAAAKRSDRETNEGRVFTMLKTDKAAILELACETDFVARNNDFIRYGNSILEKIIDNSLTEANDEIDGMIKEAVGIIKENITISKFALMSISESEYVVDYVHGEGTIGVLVKLGLENNSLKSHATVKEFAFDTALHVAAFNPQYLDQQSVDPAYLKEQEEIFTTQAKNLGKPENVVAGIVKGKINKHMSEICLQDQPFVKDDKVSVQKKAEMVSKEAGGKVFVKEFIYYRIGK
ncbi:MAG: elongation factor Ts [Spirochaetales bacterium]|nr:elongation factor Ts [Spirochaetales bacterium]